MSVSTASTFFTFEKSALPDPAKFPLADLILLAEAVELTLHGDGRTEKTVRRAWLFNSGFAREKLSDVTIPFLSGRQKVDVHTARTFMRNGRTIDAPGYALNEIVPFALDHAPDLRDVRELVVSLVGTEVGGVSLLEYTVADVEPWRAFFWGEVPVGGAFPTLEKTVTLRVPENTPLAHAGRNFDAPPEKASDGGFDVYVWKAADLPAWDPEDNLPGADRFRPAIVFSTAGAWPEVTGKLAGRVADASVSHPTFKDVVEEKTKDAADAQELALRLHKFVLEGVRTLDFHPHLIDFTFRPAAKVLDSAYGTALEKGVLLSALAREAGLRSRLFLGASEYRLKEGVAFPGADAATWVEISAARERLLLRPDRPADQANGFHGEELSLVPCSEAGEPAPPRVPKPGATSKVKVTLTLKPDLGLEGKATCTFKGAFNPYLRIASDEKTTVEAFATECASKLFPKAVAEKARASLLAPDRTTLSFDLKGAKAERIGPFVSIVWPDVPKALHGYSVPVHRDERNTPLPLPATAKISLELDIALPKDAKVKIPSPGVRKRGPASNFTTTFAEEKGKLSIRATWDFPKKTVLPEDYEKFRKAVTTSANGETRSVLLGGV